MSPPEPRRRYPSASPPSQPKRGANETPRPQEPRQQQQQQQHQQQHQHQHLQQPHQHQHQHQHQQQQQRGQTRDDGGPPMDRTQDTRSPTGLLPPLASLGPPAAARPGTLHTLLNTAEHAVGDRRGARSPRAASDDLSAAALAGQKELRHRQSLPEMRQELRSSPQVPSQHDAQYYKPPVGGEANRDRLTSSVPTYNAEASRQPAGSERGMGPPHLPSTAPRSVAPVYEMHTSTAPYAPLPAPAPPLPPSGRQALEPRFQFPPNRIPAREAPPSGLGVQFTPSVSRSEVLPPAAGSESSLGHRYDNSSSQSSFPQLEGGPLSFQIDVQAASRVADEKRRRNAGASARFRARRKEKEQQNTREIDDLKQKIQDLREDSEFYRQERDYFVAVLYNGPDRDRHFPRPTSPRRMRPPRPVIDTGYTSYEEHGQRGGDDRIGRRRLTGDYQQNQPGPPGVPEQNRAMPPAIPPPHLQATSAAPLNQGQHQYQHEHQQHQHFAATDYGSTASHQAASQFGHGPGPSMSQRYYYGTESRDAPPSTSQPAQPVHATSQDYGPPPPTSQPPQNPGAASNLPHTPQQQSLQGHTTPGVWPPSSQSQRPG